MRLRRLAASFSIGLAPILFFATTVRATPYWGPDQVRAYLDKLQRGKTGAATPAGRSELRAPQGVRTTPDYLGMLTLTAGFLRSMQVRTVGPDFGGIREGENMMTTIQTDNTSEAIWVWSRYYELTGDNQYHQNILDAFTYENSHRAYNEEGGSLPTLGYYRMYNCGWAMRAEQKYRDIYHDVTYKSYGDSCASYVRYHTLDRFGNPFYDYVNPPVLSWAVGNLYRAGMHESNQAWMDAAVQQARDKVKVWVEQDSTILGNESWAMSGGATMWGLLNSYFLANPDSTAGWVNRYKDEMDVVSQPGEFENAWDGWYAYGHRAIGLAIRDTYQLGLHIAITDSLMAQDHDHDGGIPDTPQQDGTMDQSWVSSYLAVFGLSDILGPTSGIASAGVSSEPLVRIEASPNPFATSVRLLLDLARPADLTVAIHDPAGRRVAEIARGSRAAGSYALSWDGRGASGEPVAPGVYFVTVRTQAGTTASRLVRIR